MPWTDITRPQYVRHDRRYASDCTTAEWALIEPFMPRRKKTGRSRTTYKQWALLLKQACFRRTKREQAMRGAACSYWPTPTARMSGNRGDIRISEKGFAVLPRTDQIGKQIGLKEAARVWTAMWHLFEAMGMKPAGILLIASLLVIPPAAAGPSSSTPERMALIAALVSSLGVVGGIAASLWLDTPAGPTIVMVLALIFLLSFLRGALGAAR